MFGEWLMECFLVIWSDSVLELYWWVLVYVGEYVFDVLGELVVMSEEDIVLVMVDGCFV